MTNEEAIRVLKAEWVSKESGFSDEVVREALDIAIDSINHYRRGCPLCGNKIYTEDKLNHWLSESSYDTDMPRNIIYKDIINNYLYSKVRDHTYNEDTRMLINYCPVCGERLT